jgi:hypothetical protein
MAMRRKQEGVELERDWNGGGVGGRSSRVDMDMTDACAGSVTIWDDALDSSRYNCFSPFPTSFTSLLCLTQWML